MENDKARNKTSPKVKAKPGKRSASTVVESRLDSSESPNAVNAAINQLEDIKKALLNPNPPWVLTIQSNS